MTRLATAILAAGASTRLGRPKQLVVVDEATQETLLGRTLRVACALAEDVRGPVAVVLGASAERIASVVPEDVTRVSNPAFQEGMASSVRAAVLWAQTIPCDGLLLLVCDQIRLTTDHLRALAESFRRDERTVGSAYGGTIGVPAIFERARFAELERLEGDRGARALLTGASTVDWPAGLIDVDTALDVPVA